MLGEQDIIHSSTQITLGISTLSESRNLSLRNGRLEPTHFVCHLGISSTNFQRQTSWWCLCKVQGQRGGHLLHRSPLGFNVDIQANKKRTAQPCITGRSGGSHTAWMTSSHLLEWGRIYPTTWGLLSYKKEMDVFMASLIFSCFFIYLPNIFRSIYYVPLRIFYLQFCTSRHHPFSLVYFLLSPYLTG
jgi:hypothetical protein